MNQSVEYYSKKSRILNHPYYEVLLDVLDNPKSEDFETFVEKHQQKENLDFLLEMKKYNDLCHQVKEQRENIWKRFISSEADQVIFTFIFHTNDSH
jgi:hypothetical protein